MKNISLMKEATIKSGIFTKSLREIMTETKEKALGLWYQTGAKYSSMPTFKLKMSKNPMLRTLGSFSERYGVRIVAGAALAAIGVGGIELLMHPEIAFADDTNVVDGNQIDGEITNVEETTGNENPEPTVTNEPSTPTVTNEPSTPTVTNEPSTPFAADPNAEKSDDFVDYSDVDYHLGKDNEPILDYHRDDEGNVVIDASDEEIAEKMQEFKDGNTEPETQPETEPETQPETEPETQPETEPETQPETEPKTEPKTEPGKPGGPDKPSVPVESVPETGDEVLNKTVGLAGIAIGAMAILEKAYNKAFKTDKAASANMRMGVVSQPPRNYDEYLNKFFK